MLAIHSQYPVLYLVISEKLLPPSSVIISVQSKKEKPIATAIKLNIKETLGFLITNPHENHNAGLASHTKPVNEEKKPKKPDSNIAMPSQWSPGSFSVSKHGQAIEIRKTPTLRYLIIFEKRIVLSAMQLRCE